MKKLLLLLLTFVGYVGTASATDYYVIGQLTDWSYQPATDGYTKMGVLEEGVYYADFTPTSGDKLFFISDGDASSWDDCHANHRFAAEVNNQNVSGGVYSLQLAVRGGEQNMVITGDGSTTYRLILVEETMKLTVTKVGLNLVVAGASYDITGMKILDSQPIFTNTWSATDDNNKLTLQNDGTYAITYSNITHPIGGIQLKIVENGTNWYGTGADNDPNHVLTISKESTYDITIKYYINGNLHSPIISVVNKVAGFNLVGIDGNWDTAGDALTQSGTVWSKTISGKRGSSFVIAPASAFANGIQWTECIRPSSSDNNHCIVEFAIYNGEKRTGGDSHWEINVDEDITVSYDTDTEEWTVTPASRSVDFTSVGYLTYSNGEKCTISGATPYTISKDNGETVHMQPWDSETVWPVNEGMILKRTSGATVTINPVANTVEPTDVGTNYLVGTGNNAQNITATDYTYVLANGGSGVGFYLADGDGELAAHKAYLNLDKYDEKPDAARMFLGFNFDDEATCISEAKAAKNDGIIYNLQGIRMSQMQKGLNIVNGKKVMVK